MNFSAENLMMFAGRLHPALVHFPIALILVAAFMEIFRIRRSETSSAARACLAFGALGAGIAAFSGWRWALEGNGSSMPDTLFQHRWGAIIVAVTASLTWILGCMVGKKVEGALVVWYRIGLIFSAGLVGYVGFLGGQMMYQPGHLTEVFKDDVEAEEEPAEAEAEAGEELEPEPMLEIQTPQADEPAQAGDLTPQEVLLQSQAPKQIEGQTEGQLEGQLKELKADVEDTLAEQVVAGIDSVAPVSERLDPTPRDAGTVDYKRQILPIFKASCFECHGPTGRAKGGMRLSDESELFEGDSEFWIMLPGNAAGSLLVELISEPADSEDVMPPMKGEQPAEVLTPEQIQLISRWIDQGAKY